MQITHITPEYHESPLYGLLIDALQKKGIASRVYVADNCGLEHAKPGEADNGIITYPKRFSRLARLFFRRKSRKIRRYFEQDMTAHRPDIVHAHKLFAGGAIALRWKREYGIPYITAVRNTDINTMLPMMPWLRRLAIRILQESEQIILLSPAFREKLHHYIKNPQKWAALEEKMRVLPNGIDPIFLRQQSRHKKDEKTLRLIYVGRIDDNKNVRATIEAADSLIQAGRKVTLRLVGEIMTPELAQMMEERDYIQHFARCGHQTVIHHLREADIFVMPSRKETFGLVYIEAMSQGLPVIYTRGQGIDGYFPEGTVGYGVNADDIEGLARTIETIDRDYERLSEAAYRSAGEFDWNRIAEQYITIYENTRS